MAYSKKTWVNRQTEYPGRRKLTATGTANVYDVTREEGLEIAAGDAFSAANMNDLESRVEAGFNGVSTLQATLTAAGWSASAPYTQTVSVTGVTADDNFNPPFVDPAGVQATDDAAQKALACISYGTTAAGEITFVCYEDKPETDVTLVLVRRM